MSKLGIARLQAVIEALGSIDESRFAAILQGIAGTLEPAKARAPSKPALLPPPPMDLADLPAQLNQAPSRDAAYALLKTLKKKDELMALARLIRQNPKGTRTELEERIVNATAGIRLDSAAIHNR